MSLQKLSHYKIVEKLGEGALGVIYRAKDQKQKRAVALRLLPSRLGVTDSSKKRFIEEARAATALHHPNVAETYGIEESDGNTFIVFEDVEGTMLQEKKPDLSVDEIVEITAEIAEGLKAAHSHGIIHQEIKSESIVVTPKGRAKIMDFGIATLASEAPPAAVERDSSLAYSSPERVQGGEVDQRTDLWSLGVLLYELLSGELPFRGEYDAALLYEILNAEPKALQSVRSGISDKLQALVSKLLEKDPGKRIASAEEVIECLREADRPKQAKRKKYSLSVLYFENMSPAKENEYVCTGITEDVISHLSKIQGLAVVPRSDVLPFRNRQIDSRDLGESLGVDYVLEGGVRKSGSKLTITTQLADVTSGFHLLTDRFDRLVDDIFDLQYEVVKGVADALKIQLSDAEKESISRRPTKDVRAYDFYLRAREFLSYRGKNKAQAAIKMLDNALAIDPNFILAYTALADAYASMFTYYDGDRTWLKKIHDVSEKALEFDPDLVEAHFSVAIAHFHDKQFDKAKGILEDVVKRRPHYYDAHWWLGIIDDIVGDFDQALQHYEVASAIKPYSVEPWLYMNMTHRRKGDAGAAKESATRFLEVGLRRLEVNPDDAVTLSRFAVIYTLFGDREKAHAALARILEDDPDDGMVLYNCASTYALLSDRKNALRCLRIALEKGFRNVLEWLGKDPDFDDMRDTDEFKLLMAEFERPEED